MSFKMSPLLPWVKPEEQPLDPVRCPTCERAFYPNKRGQRFCGSHCRRKFWNKQHPPQRPVRFVDESHNATTIIRDPHTPLPTTLEQLDAELNKLAASTQPTQESTHSAEQPSSEPQPDPSKIDPSYYK